MSWRWAWAATRASSGPPNSRRPIGWPMRTASAAPSTPARCAAIRDLPVTRIGHGVRSSEDPKLLEELVRRGIALEVCPGSNVALGLYPNRNAHPLPRLIAGGVRVTLGSDDPPFFHTTLGMEYD